MAIGLADLPIEVLSSIVIHLRTAKALLQLSLTCKRLHGYIEEDGFRVFVRNCFPSIQVPPYWKDAAHCLVELSRAWDRKLFNARSLRPSPEASNHKSRRYQKRQTMGYQPVIDSYSEQSGSCWASKKEVLAWGAGAKLVIRRVNPVSKNHPGDEVDSSYPPYLWAEVAGRREGRDDITSINFLRPNQKVPDTPEQIVIGRANGDLERLQLLHEDKASQVLSKYITGNRPVRSATITTSRNPLLAASLSDGTVAVYPMHGITSIQPFGEISVTTTQKTGKIWTTKFLASDLLAVGSGLSKEPLNIYNICPDRVSHTPLRTYQCFNDDWNSTTEAVKEAPVSSVYSIAPLGPSASAGGNEGEVFPSGWFTGGVRLHDLRSPKRQAAFFNDPLDQDSAVYSLVPIGRERFLAGGARHCILKVFDLRMPGGKVYFATDAEPCRNLVYRRKSTEVSCCDFHHQSYHARRDYSIYLYPPNPMHNNLGRRPPKVESPVYSLSSPAPYSSRIYAGLENEVVQIDVGTMMQRAISENPEMSTSRHRNHAFCLSAYEHSESGSVLMATQRPGGQQGVRPAGENDWWGERWGERWDFGILDPCN